ncbi:hypothetical protein [Mesorhizobium sp. M0491]|uniref:hypothetical protein n=1 Tax=Mesorhizobium sp. M0491 TaxID=2956950 RepID=UPI0033362605
MTLWCVNIHGPDDVVAVADYPTAIKVANTFNAWWQRQERRENDPHLWAVPIEWPYSEASHAESLVDTSGEYAGFIAAALASSEAIEWTPELEAARIALCHFWLKIADDPQEGGVRYPELGRRAIETEQALTILGDYARLTAERT